ncbi:hypothetical protein B5F79_08605 [Olsenella sp. An285]|uniref:hypothetical protein n=1 Tax=Olsenella sp. An285 TaxID=1965621 RepID=UPI000B3A4797|nr:hypothetical protein [Olsenella sp. An285]OUO45997.1 hypothetical protein B5F79_08605 [Olsenella sp. An285]
MQYSKKVIASMPKAYAIGMFEGEDARSFVIGVEKDGPIRRFALDGTPMETVTEGPGGVMTITQVPGRKDQLLATSEFFSPNYGGDTAGIVSYTRAADGTWSTHRICDLPYVHRFGVLVGADGQLWLIACTIKGACRKIKNDWLTPGAVYVAKLGDSLETETVELTELSGCQLQNHGFWTNEDHTLALVSTAAGVFRYVPPATADGEWSVSCLIVQPTSDICVADFDGDGKDEILTLSAFHGDTLSVWHEGDTEDTYKKVWEDPEKRDFLHAIWSGTIAGEPCAVIGNRKAGRDLFRVHFADGTYQLEMIDHDRGPANCWVFTDGDATRIIAANRETDEVALYDVTE